MYKLEQLQLKRFEMKVSFVLNHFHFVSRFDDSNKLVIELFLNNENNKL